jgi:glycosyltransferase involved in cell wall biosynthesis
VKILQCVGDIDPALGGSVEAARQLSIALDDLGHTADLLTLSEPRDAWKGDWRGKIHSVGPSSTYYLYNPRLAAWVAENAARYDAVVIHGLWRYTGFGVWRGLRALGVPYFVFAHGMLDPYFRRAFPWKHVKKYLCWLAAERRVLRDARAVLFTCEEERLRARRTFWPYKCQEQVVGLGIRGPSGYAGLEKHAFLSAFPALAGKRIVLSLGRIHPKKGWDLLIEGFARVAAADPQLHLVLAGPDECGWQAHLERLARQQGVDGRLTWTGPLYGEMKWGAMRAAEVFAVPSHIENFGITIAEAMACGVPVLISDQVNIWREIQADGAGFVAPADAEGATSLLTRWLEASGRQRLRMKDNALACFRSRFDLHRFAGRFVECLEPL